MGIHDFKARYRQEQAHPLSSARRDSGDLADSASQSSFSQESEPPSTPRTSLSLLTPPRQASDGAIPRLLPFLTNDPDTAPSKSHYRTSPGAAVTLPGIDALRRPPGFVAEHSHSAAGPQHRDRDRATYKYAPYEQPRRKKRAPHESSDESDGDYRARFHEQRKPASSASTSAAEASGTFDGDRWVCNIGGCVKSFPREGDLKRHQRTSKLHARSQFFCECGSSFTRADGLKRHITSSGHRPRDQHTSRSPSPRPTAHLIEPFQRLSHHPHHHHHVPLPPVRLRCRGCGTARFLDHAALQAHEAKCYFMTVLAQPPAPIHVGETPT